MPLSTILLKTGTVPTGDPTDEDPDYAPADTDPKNVAIVKSMRFTNTGSGTSKLNVWFQKGGGDFSSASARRILPLDQPIPAGYTLVDDSEMTLDSGDGIYARVDAGTVEFTLCGAERDAS